MDDYEASPSYSNTALKSNPVSAAASGSIGNRRVNSGNYDSSSSSYQQQYNTTSSTQTGPSNPYNNSSQQHHSGNTHPGSGTSSNSYPDHHHQYTQQQQHPANHQQHQQQQQQAYHSSNYSNSQYSSTGNNHTAASAGNVNNASTTEYRQSQPQQPQSNNYSYSNSNMSTEAASNSSNRTYPHQSSHPDPSTNSYAATDGGGNVLQPQAPSSTTQASYPHQQQQQSQQQSQSYYPSNSNNSNTNAAPSQSATSTGQAAPSSSSSSRNRTVSGGFETVKAGPPTEGKMDLLPYPHNHHQQQHGQQQQNQAHQQQNKQQQQSGSSNVHRRDSSSSRHRNRHSISSTQVHHPQPQRPNSQINAITAQTPSNTYQGEYHEPVAPSSGRSANSKGSSTTSEFTKRKNWSQRIVEEMQDILHVLSPDGTVLFVSPSLYDLCGITPEEMVGNLITDYMDPLDVDHFKEEFENSIMTEASLTTYYRLRKRNINGVGNNSRVNSSGTLAGLGRLKEEDSDDSNHLGQHSNDLSNAAAEAFAAINLKSDTLLLEITGQPYYTSSPDGTKHHKKGSNNRRNREAARDDDDDENDENQDEDSRMTNAGDSGNNASSSSSSGSNAHPHKSKHSSNNKKSNNSRSNSGGGGTKTCKCFFAMARPYPSRNNATLDTFLELKIENEKLRNKLANIYREIEGDDSNAASNNSAGGIDYSGMGVTHADNGSGYQIRSSGDGANKPQQQAYFGADPMAVDTFAPHERQISGFPSRMSGVFASQQANSGNTSTGRDGLGSRKDYDMEEGNQSLDSPRHATQPGLGMRGGPIDSGDGLISSAGLIPSTSNTYGALGIGISANARANASNTNTNAGQDDASLGNANPASITSNLATAQSNANSLQAANAANVSAAAAAAAAAAEDKKKKMKKQRTDEGEFVCRDCGTVDSPEWRRGPLGPKTLCNACGLRWAKKNKQQQRNSLGGNEVITITR